MFAPNAHAVLYTILNISMQSWCSCQYCCTISDCVVPKTAMSMLMPIIFPPNHYCCVVPVPDFMQTQDPSPATDSKVSSQPTARGHLGGIWVYNMYTCTVGTLALNVQLSRVSQCTYQSVQTVQTSPEPLPEAGSRPIRSVKKIDIRTNWLNH